MNDIMWPALRLDRDLQPTPGFRATFERPNERIPIGVCGEIHQDGPHTARGRLDVDGHADAVHLVTPNSTAAADNLHNSEREPTQPTGEGV